MGTLFLEIVFDARECAARGFQRFEELELALDGALSAAGLGTLTGDGSGGLATIIEFEVKDSERVEEAIALLRRSLRQFGVPPSTLIKCYEPERRKYPAYA